MEVSKTGRTAQDVPSVFVRHFADKTMPSCPELKKFRQRSCAMSPPVLPECKDCMPVEAGGAG
jgi:hypothetical protein